MVGSNDFAAYKKGKCGEVEFDMLRLGWYGRGLLVFVSSGVDFEGSKVVADMKGHPINFQLLAPLQRRKAYRLVSFDDT